MPLKNVLVALDGSAASNAALRGALAIQIVCGAHIIAIVSLDLQSSGSGGLFPWVPEVILITVGAPLKARIASSGLDPQTALERQDVTANWIGVEEKGRSIAGALLDSTKGYDADILIMGAYEHSKFREDIFGGVTRDVMASAPIPIFLVH